MNKKSRSLFFLTISFSFLFILTFAFLSNVEARRKIIEFLPVNEKIENETWTGSVIVGEVSCDRGQFIEDMLSCDTCQGYFQKKCDSCCITAAGGSAAATNQERAHKCTEEASSDYSCNPQAFNCAETNYDQSCTDYFEDCVNATTTPNCQKKGCPDSSFKPDYNPSPAANPLEYCTQDPNDPTTWFCAKDNNSPLDNLTPEDRGCTPLAGVTIGRYDSDFHASSPSTDDFYTVTTVTSMDTTIQDQLETALEMTSGTLTSYYQYVARNAYTTYINNCRDYTDSQQLCEKGIYCCKQNVCPNSGGYANNCGCDDLIYEWDFDTGTLEDVDEVTKCCGQGGEVNRVNCNENYLTSEDCANLRASANIIDCGFQPIVNSFKYNFVPKTGESFVFQWTATVNPQVSGGVSTEGVYFYTRLRIYNKTNEETKWSPVHQKGFTGSFTVFSGVARENDLNPFLPGNSYEVSIYYFIPDPDNDSATEQLSATITRLSLNIFRTRE